MTEVAMLWVSLPVSLEERSFGDESALVVAAKERKSRSNDVKLFNR